MKNERFKGKHLIQLWLDEDKWIQVQQAAESVQEPVTVWCRRAIFGVLRKWELPQATVLFAKCSFCGKKHDPKEHGVE